MNTPETKLTGGTDGTLLETEPSITINTIYREVLRITPDGRIIAGKGLSMEEATQEAAKLLMASFEDQIQEMLDARVAATKEASK
jgi:hypothetical protein